MIGFFRQRCFLLLAILFFLMLFLSLFIGRYAITPSELFALVRAELFGLDSGLPSAARTAFFVIRLPRIVGVIFVGAGLSAAGTVYQGVFKNPMASPDILGSAAGSGLGAAVGILLSFTTLSVQIMSFAGGLAAVGLTCWISYMVEGKRIQPMTLVLTGLVISSVFQAGISLAKYVADPTNTLPAITFWLLGTFSSVGKSDARAIAAIVTLALIPMLLLRWRLSVLSMGDEEAATLGVKTGPLRLVMIICATIITSTSVAFCGVIGWVGLVIPHLSRMLVGSNNVRTIPASLLLGSSFMMLVDNIARSAMSIELPIGVLTAVIGAPFFLYLLKRGKKAWN